MADNNKLLEAAGEIISHKAILEILQYDLIDNTRFSKDEDANTLLAKAADKLGTTASAFLNSPSKLDKVKTALGMETRGINEGVIQVQYNPASIKYSGNVPETKTTHKTEERNGYVNVITTVTNTSTIKMSFTLVFHSKYTADLSVREQMELIMNMIYDSPTKEVKFSWANMEAKGKLVAFSGTYDMFDMTGNPISGKMDLTIRLSVSDSIVTKQLKEAEKERKDKVEG